MEEEVSRSPLIESTCWLFLLQGTNKTREFPGIAFYLELSLAEYFHLTLQVCI